MYKYICVSVRTRAHTHIYIDIHRRACAEAHTCACYVRAYIHTYMKPTSGIAEKGRFSMFASVCECAHIHKIHPEFQKLKGKKWKKLESKQKEKDKRKKVGGDEGYAGWKKTLIDEREMKGAIRAL